MQWAGLVLRFTRGALENARIGERFKGAGNERMSSQALTNFRHDDTSGVTAKSV